ncbi:MAG: glycosyltransferase [Candidatus Izemoplasmatales bacterium]|jgi:GT2 family glycosyltransferase
MLKIDPHVHLPTNPEEMAGVLWHYVEEGFKAIVVTHRATADVAWAAEKMVSSRKIPLIIVPGAEVVSSEGEVISVIGAVRHHIITGGMPAQHLVDFIHSRGGLAFLCHSRRVPKDLQRVDGIQRKYSHHGVQSYGDYFEIEGDARTDEEVIALLRNPSRVINYFKDTVSPKLLFNGVYDRGAVSVVIPIHNCPDFLESAVESLKTTNYQKMKIVLVDNNSTDPGIKPLLDKYEEEGCLVIRRKINDGFSKSVNIGCRATDAEFLVLFNQDAAAIDPEWINNMVEMFEEKPRCGVQGAKLIYPNTNILQHIGLEFPEGCDGNHRFLQQSADIPEANISCQVSAVTGAVFAIRHCVFDELGGLSEEYTMGCEDSDFCFQVRDKLGMQVWFNHQVLCSHVDNGIKKRTLGSMNLVRTSSSGFQPKWTDFLRALPEQNRDTKIAFVLPASGMSGGCKVIWSVLNHLVSRGYNACLYTLDGSRPTDFPVDFNTYPFSELRGDSNQVLVATRFDTAYAIMPIEAKKKLYVVQHHEVIMAAQCGATEEFVRGSYRLPDLDIITIGSHLQKILKEEYDHYSDIVDVGLDCTLFNFEGRVEQESPVRILFYGAGQSPWKGYYDCLDVLQMASEKYGSRISISCFDKNMTKPNVPYISKHYRPETQEDVAKIYKEHDIFISLSHGEGFGMTPVEALASKCSVLVSNHTGMQQWAKDGENCLVSNYKDNKDAFSKLCKLIDNPELRMNLAEYGSQSVRKYDWGLVVNQWIPHLLGV